MNIVTVEELAALCANECKKGNGKKHILISQDDEGNGYHGLFFGFTPVKDVFKGEYQPSCYLDKVKDETHIVLG